MTVNITKIVDWRRPSGRWVANAAGRLLRVRNDDLGREGFLIARAWIESRRRSRRKVPSAIVVGVASPTGLEPVTHSLGNLLVFSYFHVVTNS